MGLQQPAGGPGVLGEDQIGGAQRPDGSWGEIGRIAQGGRNDVENSRRPSAARIVHVSRKPCTSVEHVHVHVSRLVTSSDGREETRSGRIGGQRSCFFASFYDQVFVVGMKLPNDLVARVVDQFASVELGDPRREARLRAVAARMARHP